MLKSSGYFSNIACPYYASGLCERPHCHYKHGSSVPTYVPTPVYKTVVSKPDVAPSKRKSSLKPGIPEYKPTPISELKKLKRNNSSDETGIKSQDLKTSSKDNEKTKVHKKPEKSQNVVSDLKKSPSSSEENLKESKPHNKSDKKHGKVPKLEKSLESSTITKSTKDHVANGSEQALRKCSSAEEEISDCEADNGNVSPDISDNESQNDNKTVTDCTKRTVDEKHEIIIPTKKQRVAHQASQNSKVPTLLSTLKPNKLSPAQIMFNRFAALSKATPSTPESQACGKKRIAHSITPSLVSKSSSTSSSSSLDSAKSCDKPQSEPKRPTLPLEFGSKVPIALRQKYLNKIIDECLKCCPTPQKAYERGLQEEKSLYKRSTSKAIYINISANAIKRLRDEGSKASEAKLSKESQGPSKPGNRQVSHEAILNGPQAVGCSIEKRNKSLNISDLSDAMLYEMLMKFALAKDQLKTYGYPLPNPDNQEEVILPKPENKIINNFLSSRRTCCRCKTPFQVNADGVPLKREPCIYHPGRLWNERINKSLERRYSCCKGDTSSGGCCSAKSHVVDGYGHPDYLKGYVSSKPSGANESFCGIYALDCEMCYTTAGLELTRVSVIDHKCNAVYESLVKPKNEILDYNTRFSGIHEGDLDKVTTTITDVQEKLLSFVKDKTILVGHSLESDFKALKLLHETVVDTAAVFPHNRGLPYRRALRTLIAEYLKKIIQDEVGGHDSQEDAASCMQLMLWKVKEELSKMKLKKAP